MQKIKTKKKSIPGSIIQTAENKKHRKISKKLEKIKLPIKEHR